jgi:hypothetical protein
MKKKVILLALTVAGLAVPFVGRAHAATVPAACVAGNVGPAHLQLGYAPNGPAGCTKLP